MGQREIDEKYMRRCLQLAACGQEGAPPNPMVGAVIVHNGRIIGEGYHQRCGEAHAEVNLEQLCRMLWTRTYRPQPSCCFVITEPKRREVFAAQFRDRIIHHLYFNYTHLLYEATFIRDSYSCIEGRGTLDGILRLSHHIRQCSLNYTRECYVLKLDIRGYFMHIDRQRLLRICLSTLDRMATHRITKEAAAQYGLPVNDPPRWKDVIDIDFVKWLTDHQTAIGC